MINLPYEKEQSDSLGDHRRMKSKVIISSNGIIEVFTHTSTAKALQGFHGRVTVTLRTENGDFLHQTSAYQYGVDGVRVGDPSRDDKFIETIPEEKLMKIGKCEIKHDQSKKALSPSDLENWAKLIREIKE
ncbi:hypothetical protein [Clostridium perfringens]|uniref:hypothetical protein n=1 Tax=Clostridium perfringens TaxID=1502 RepID=UPI0039E8B956